MRMRLNYVLAVFLVKLSNCRNDCLTVLMRRQPGWNPIVSNSLGPKLKLYDFFLKVNKLPIKQFNILDTFITLSESVKNLGVFMDFFGDVSMNSHIRCFKQSSQTSSR